MCRSMVDIQSATAEIRRGIKKIEDRRRNQRTKIKCPHLLRRAAITSSVRTEVSDSEDSRNAKTLQIEVQRIPVAELMFVFGIITGRVW